MSNLDSAPDIKNVLIVTSSGGGGLLQAANAKEQEILAQFPYAVVVQRDVMKHWMWKGLGSFFASLWNRAQLRGDVFIQTLLGKYGAPVIEYFFWPHIFFCSLVTIYKRDIDRVIDTQVMGTSALIKALRIFNWTHKKQIILEKILVDLPTPKATHFFKAIKSLSEADKRYFKLITIAPLLQKGQSAEEFWKLNCNLTNSELKYEDFYVRQAFRAYRNTQPKHRETTLTLKYKNKEELSLIERSVSKGALRPKIGDHQIEYRVAESDRVITILLGSQPSREGTLGYVRRFIELAKEIAVPTHLFVFCADHKPGTTSLMKAVSDTVLKTMDFPRHLTVIPMSFQSDNEIAPLFHRSDITCTRSGGQTAMEIMSVGTGDPWVHSEAKLGRSPLTEEELLAGIPVWESANAVYMQRMVGAKLVTPDSFMPYARKILLGE